VTATWDVTDPDAVGASYQLTATGQTSGLTAQAEFTDGFGLSKLTVGGGEDYLFTAGDKIVPTGNVDNGKYYDIVITDPNGVRRNSFVRTATSNFSTADNSYTIQASDPITTSKAYTFTLREFADATTTTVLKSSVKSFYVAQVTTYSDAALATLQNTFGVGGTAYVTVTGLQPGKADWKTTWFLPDGTTVAGANNAHADRPDTNASGVLAVGT